MAMKRREFLCASAAAACSALVRPALAAAEPWRYRWHERMHPCMGTFVSIAVYHHDDKEAQRWIDQTFVFLQRVVARISDWESASDPSRLRRTGVLTVTECSPEFWELAQVCAKVAELSSGSFSPLCEDLTLLWRSAREAGAVPDAGAVREACRRAAESRVRFEPGRIALEGAGSFDVGGVGKGFAADLACRFLRNLGARYCRVAGSGDIAFSGDTEWEIELEHPRDEARRLGVIRRRGSFGIATSGDYRSAWFVRGTRYHHLIDQRTGYPGRCCSQATVLHPSPGAADGLATAAFFMPPRAGLRFIERIPNAEAVLVGADGEVHCTKGALLV